MICKHLTVNIISPDGQVFEGVAAGIFLPGMLCPFEVLPGHAPIISTLDGGEIKVVPVEGEEGQTIRIRSGVARVKDDMVTICAEL